MYGLCGPSLCRSLCLACSLHPHDTAVWMSQQKKSLEPSSSGNWGPTYPIGLRPCSPDSAQMGPFAWNASFFPFNFLFWNDRLTRSCQNSTEKSHALILQLSLTVTYSVTTVNYQNQEADSGTTRLSHQPLHAHIEKNAFVPRMFLSSFFCMQKPSCPPCPAPLGQWCPPLREAQALPVLTPGSQK